MTMITLFVTPRAYASPSSRPPCPETFPLSGDFFGDTTQLAQLIWDLFTACLPISTPLRSKPQTFDNRLNRQSERWPSYAPIVSMD